MLKGDCLTAECNHVRAAAVAAFALRRRRRRDELKSLRPSPSTPAVPPPGSPRSPALDRGGFAPAPKQAPAQPPKQAAPPSAAASAAPGGDPPAGKTSVIPYSQYRKSRLNSIRSDLGLTGGVVWL